MNNNGPNAWTQIAWLALAPVGGVVLAASLVGGDWAALAPLGLMPLVCLVRTTRRSVFCIGSFAFALCYFGYGLRGLLRRWEGAFAAVWFGFTLSLAAIECLLLLLLHTALHKRPAQLWWTFPIAFTATEYALHRIVAVYDGNGMTFLTAGQGLAEFSLVRQITDLGGMWMLTSLAALTAAIAVGALDPTATGKRRLQKVGLLFICTVVVLGYGWTRCAMYHPHPLGTAIIVNTMVDTRIVRQVEQAMKGDSDLTYIVTPELSISWPESRKQTNLATAQQNHLQEEMLRLTLNDDTIAIIGAAIKTEAGLVRNSRAIAPN